MMMNNNKIKVKEIKEKKSKLLMSLFRNFIYDE